MVVPSSGPVGSTTRRFVAVPYEFVPVGTCARDGIPVMPLLHPREPPLAFRGAGPDFGRIRDTVMQAAWPPPVELVQERKSVLATDQAGAPVGGDLGCRQGTPPDTHLGDPPVEVVVGYLVPKSHCTRTLRTKRRRRERCPWQTGQKARIVVIYDF